MHPDILFLSHKDTLEFLGVADALRICEEVYRMQARKSVVLSTPPSLKMDVGEEFQNHWHVKATLLKEIPATGLRLYNYYDDGNRNNVGGLDCMRYILLSDPRTGEGLAIVDEHWIYGIRSAAGTVLACKWLGPATPRILGLVGVGSMTTNALRCLSTFYKFDEIRCTSRTPQTREAFAKKWSAELGIPVRAMATPEEVARGADLIVSGTTSADIICREEWLKPGSTFISFARRDLDPAGWSRMDKVVLDGWELKMQTAIFRQIVESGQFSRSQMYGEIYEVVSGEKPGRTRDDERILIATTGLVAQDIALAHHIYLQAKAAGRGIMLPAAR